MRINSTTSSLMASMLNAFHLLIIEIGSICYVLHLLIIKHNSMVTP